MAKKKGGLSHIYPKDKRCFALLAKSGAMSRDTLHRLEITDNRIKSYKQAGLIKEVSVPDRHGNEIKNFYELTDKKGKDFCRQECGIKQFISNGNASIHNAKVSEYLADNLSKKELDSVISERELQPFIESRLQEYLDKQDSIMIKPFSMVPLFLIISFNEISNPPPSLFCMSILTHVQNPSNDIQSLSLNSVSCIKIFSFLCPCT